MPWLLVLLCNFAAGLAFAIAVGAREVNLFWLLASTLTLTMGSIIVSVEINKGSSQK